MKTGTIFLILICSHLVYSIQQENSGAFIKNGRLPNGMMIINGEIYAPFDVLMQKNVAPSIVVNNSNNAKGTFNQESNNSAHSDQIQENKQELQQNEVENNIQLLAEKNLFEKQQEYCTNKLDNILSFINQHRFKGSCIALLATYSYILYQIHVANTIIFDTSSWSNWQGNRSLEELFTIPQTQLEADLLYVFQNRHIDLHNPTDFIYSLVHSSLSLEEEIHIVSKQINRCKWIANCYSSYLFFIDSNFLAVLQEKHKKLLFIKHIFSSWCATYKIDKNI